MQLIVLDFETYYTNKDLGFKTQTTEEYIRDPRFEVIGVAVKVGAGEAIWFSGDYLGTYSFLQTFDWANSMVVAHNAMFDMAILNWHFGIKPKAIADTLSMARAIHGTEVGNSLKKMAEYYELGVKGIEVVDAINLRRKDFPEQQLAQYGLYCINDVALTYDLFMTLLPQFQKVELKLIDLTIRMFTEPVLCLDQSLLEQHLVDVKDRKARLLAECGANVDDLMSNLKFATLLRGLGVEPPTKISLTTGKETLAFAKSDEGFKALAEHPDERVQVLMAARLGNKSTLEETRTERLIGIAKRGEIPVPLSYYAAHTGRWGGCLVADTEVMVYNTQNGVEVKRIVDVLLDDLVWDGEAFVPHEGVVFSGFSEVISWDGVTGTEDHVVFTDTGEISLRNAMQGGHRIAAAGSPSQDNVDTARKFARNHQAESSV